MIENNALPQKLVTKEDLINSGFSINKKLVMIDSRAYTKEAFEYVLKLSDNAGSLTFIYDRQKIWANGQYFGGDVFHEELNYFDRFVSVNKDNALTGIIQAAHPTELVKFMGLNNMEILAKTNPETGEHTISFDYNLSNAVDTSSVDINGTQFSLIVENNKIKLNQYQPMVVILDELEPLELDSINNSYVSISVKINIWGSIPDPSKLELKINVETEDGSEVKNINLDEENNIFSADIPVNINTKFSVFYSDGITSGTAVTEQLWGYAILLGKYNALDYEYTIDDERISFNDIYNSLKNSYTKKVIWVPNTRLNFDSNLDVKNFEYGILSCPVEMNVEFTDLSVNVKGGWQPMANKLENLYNDSYKKEFIVWRTDYRGIGLVNWSIVGEDKTKNTNN